jgi:small basic protein
MPASRVVSRTAATAGTLAVVAIPTGILASRWIAGVSLLQSLYYSVPFALVASLGALFGSRRARVQAQRTVFQERTGPVRAARRLAWVGLYAGVTGGLAIGVYWVLRSRH